jgi:hypothetical protein
MPSIPAGFEVMLAAEQDVFAVVLKDTRDPCFFALFSDQKGLIYSGRPLQ